MFKQTDEKLISKALTGNERAWLKLVTRYEKDVFHYCLRMVGNPDDAKDLMQDVFIGICRNLSAFRGDSMFKTWALKIAHFRCVEYFRRKKDFANFDEVYQIEDDSQASNPYLEMIQGQQNNAIISALKMLPVNQKIVIELKFFQHHTFEEIAHDLGISSNTAKSRMYAGIEKLKKYLEEQNEQSRSA